MSFEQFLFYLFSAVLVMAALRVVTASNSVHAALSLVLAFFTSAGLWMLLEAEFLALTLILVYVGAVMVLFLFVVMMVNLEEEQVKESLVKYLPLGIVVVITLLIEMGLLLRYRFVDYAPAAVKHAADYSNTKELGENLYTNHLYSFEVAAVILLVAIVAAIALVLRKRTGVKRQNIPEQVAVKRNDRVRLVEMETEYETGDK